MACFWKHIIVKLHKKTKQNKKDEKLDKNLQKIEYQRKIHQMDMETYLKIEQRRKQMKELKKNSKSTDGLTGN